MAAARVKKEPAAATAPVFTGQWAARVVPLSEMESMLNWMAEAGYTIDSYELVDSPDPILSANVQYVLIVGMLDDEPEHIPAS